MNIAGWLWATHWLILFILAALSGSRGQINVTIENTAPELIYTPSVCNGGECAWQVRQLQGSSGDSVTTTNGSDATEGNLIPQLYFAFKGLALFIVTSPFSDALANITLYTEDPNVSITTQIDTAVGLIGVVDLPGDRVTTLAITFVASDHPTRLDIDTVTVTTANNNTSPFVNVTLPPPGTIPTFVPAPPSEAPLAHSRRQSPADIAAEVLGGVLGLILGGFGAVLAKRLFSRWRRRRAASQPPV